MNFNGIENLRIKLREGSMPTSCGRELQSLLAAPQGQQIPGSRSAFFFLSYPSNSFFSGFLSR